MPKCPPARLPSLCGFARVAKVPRWLRFFVTACCCIFVNLAAATAATNSPDGEWSVAISCEQSSYAQAFSFREQVRIVGGKFSLTHRDGRFLHEFSGSIEGDRVRITGLGKISFSTDRLWRFSGRAESPREVRIKGFMNGRDTGAPFYQECEVLMSALETTATTRAAARPEASEPAFGLKARNSPQSGGASHSNAATTPEVAAESHPSASEPRFAPGQASQALPPPTAASPDQAKKSAPIAPTGTTTAPSRPTVAASPLVPSKPRSEAALPASPAAGESPRKSVTGGSQNQPPTRFRRRYSNQGTSGPKSLRTVRRPLTSLRSPPGRESCQPRQEEGSDMSTGPRFAGTVSSYKSSRSWTSRFLSKSAV